MLISIWRKSAIPLICITFAILQCTSLQTAGGTGSETVIGTIIQEDGKPAGETVVSLYPNNFDPASDPLPSNLSVDTTDSEGRYEITFNSANNQKFTLQAINLVQRTRAIISDISATGDSTKIAVTSLHKTGSIKVNFSKISETPTGYIYIPGTTYYSYLKNGYAIVDSVPAQAIAHFVFKDSSDLSLPQSIADTLDVKAGITTLITFSGVAHARKISLNTTPAGADITDNVLGFPLLIRLSGSNFNFKEARTDGSDLRFTKSNDIAIPFEIERWDAAAQQAEIWVKLDTVYGNKNSQFFVMYWGEPASSMALNATKVFDTTGGYRGVWHLAEEAAGVGTKGLYKDATGRNNGDDFISTTDRSGIIGYGHAFDGVDDYIPLNSPVTSFVKSELTIAVWVNIKDSGGTILSKLDSTPLWNIGESSFYFGDGTNADTPGTNGTRPSFVEYANSSAISSQSITPGGWHHLAFTWKWHGDSTGTARFFIDGTEVPLSRDSLYLRINEKINATIRIGQPNNNESHSYFNGFMDELEISAVTRSADWIKLSYMNQQKENVLLTY